MVIYRFCFNKWETPFPPPIVSNVLFIGVGDAKSWRSPQTGRHVLFVLFGDAMFFCAIDLLLEMSSPNTEASGGGPRTECLDSTWPVTVFHYWSLVCSRGGRPLGGKSQTPASLLKGLFLQQIQPTFSLFTFLHGTSLPFTQLKLSKLLLSLKNESPIQIIAL